MAARELKVRSTAILKSGCIKSVYSTELKWKCKKKLFNVQNIIQYASNGKQKYLCCVADNIMFNFILHDNAIHTNTIRDNVALYAFTNTLALDQLCLCFTDWVIFRRHNISSMAIACNHTDECCIESWRSKPFIYSLLINIDVINHMDILQVMDEILSI